MAEATVAAGIRSLIAPLAEYNLLLPGTTVAEVVPFQEATAGPDSTDAQRWILGSIEWRGLRIPHVSMEAYAGGEPASPGARAQLIIIKGVSQLPRLWFYAVTAQRIPRLVTVSAGMLEPLQDAGLEHAPGEAVLVAGEPAVVPDLEALESSLHAALNVSKSS